jgi:hypothetical protein
LEIVVWTYWVGTFKYGRIPATIKIKNLYDVVEKGRRFMAHITRRQKKSRGPVATAQSRIVNAV